MSASSKPELSEGQQTIVDTCIIYEKMLDDLKTMSLDEKNLGYFGLAYEYFLLDLEEEGTRLLEKMDKDFFDEPLTKAIKKDPKIMEITQIMLTKLMEIGYIKITVKD